MAAHKLILIAGPCVVESFELLDTVANTLVKIAQAYPVQLIFKSSYRKANRSSLHSFTGIGDQVALEMLQEIRQRYQIPVLTDIHAATEAALAAQYVDILQIPAFLCRQTDILLAAAETGKPINIKKGQFLSGREMQYAVEKIRSRSTAPIFLTERGTFFGYHDLVVDFRSLAIMRTFPDCQVIYDATHSVQRPGLGSESGGQREFIFPLARAAVAVGVDGIFFEVHPNPERAKSDRATQLPLQLAETFIAMLVPLHQFVQQHLSGNG